MGLMVIKGGAEAPEKDGMARSIRMPERVWRTVDADAAKCRRSATKQIEAILTVYYQLDSVELADPGAARSVVSPQLARDVQSGEAKDMLSRLRELYDNSVYKDKIDEELKGVISVAEGLPKTRAADEVKPARRSKGQDKG